MKNKVIVMVLMLSSFVLMQFAHEQVPARENQTLVISQQQAEEIINVVDNFDAVMKKSVTLEALFEKMAQSFMKLKKIKESYSTTEAMQYSQELKKALNDLDEIYGQCAVEMEKIGAATNESVEAILHMLLVKVLAQ